MAKSKFPLLFFWLGEDAYEYCEFDNMEDWEDYLEHLEMTRLGY